MIFLQPVCWKVVVLFCRGRQRVWSSQVSHQGGSRSSDVTWRLVYSVYSPQLSPTQLLCGLDASSHACKAPTQLVFPTCVLVAMTCQSAHAFCSLSERAGTEKHCDAQDGHSRVTGSKHATGINRPFLFQLLSFRKSVSVSQFDTLSPHRQP